MDEAIRILIRSLLESDLSPDEIAPVLARIMRSENPGALPGVLNDLIRELQAMGKVVPEWLLKFRDLVWERGAKIADPEKLAKTINEIKDLLRKLGSKELEPIYQEYAEALRKSFFGRVGDTLRLAIRSVGRQLTIATRWLGRQLVRIGTVLTRLAISAVKVLLAGIRYFRAAPLWVSGLALLALIVIVVGLYFLYSYEKESQIAQVPDCDCSHVDAGLLTREYQQECRGREAVLLQLVKECGGRLPCVAEKLKLKTGADGKLVGGEFCDSTTSGPAAWPIYGSGPAPPPRPAKAKPCETVSGISRKCE